jgi:Zn-dependent metalloprotease
MPPHILDHLAKKAAQKNDDKLRDAALETLMHSAYHAGQRSIVQVLPSVAILPTGEKRRHVFDAMHLPFMLPFWPGRLVLREGGLIPDDVAVKEAYEYSGLVYDFYLSVFQRNSIDGQGMPLDSTVHYRIRYDNAMWNGRQMIYGDGDEQFFNRFTIALDVVGHELTHGVTQSETNLNYQGESGALNESFSDVMGVLIKQWNRGWTVAQAEAEGGWLIGQGLLKDNVQGGTAGQPAALRTMLAGKAYDDPEVGTDIQPKHRDNILDENDPRARRDNGGVHINSGIPNHAFYRVAKGLGDATKAWEDAGHIWYAAFSRNGPLRPEATFQDAANATFVVAGTLFGAGSRQQLTVRDGWGAVGYEVAEQASRALLRAR